MVLALSVGGCKGLTELEIKEAGMDVTVHVVVQVGGVLRG